MTLCQYIFKNFPFIFIILLLLPHSELAYSNRERSTFSWTKKLPLCKILFAKVTVLCPVCYYMVAPNSQNRAKYSTAYVLYVII